MKYLPDMLAARNHRIVKALAAIAKRCIRKFGESDVFRALSVVKRERAQKESERTKALRSES